MCCFVCVEVCCAFVLSIHVYSLVFVRLFFGRRVCLVRVFVLFVFGDVVWCGLRCC